MRSLHKLFVHCFPFLSWSGQRGERRDSIFTNGYCAWKGGTRFSSFDGNPSVSDRRQLGIPCWVRSSVPPRIPSPPLLPPNVLPSLRSSAFARPWPDNQLVRHVSTNSTTKPTLLPPGWNDTDIHYCYLWGKPLSEIQNIFWEFPFLMEPVTRSLRQVLFHRIDARKILHVGDEVDPPPSGKSFAESFWMNSFVWYGLDRVLSLRTVFLKHFPGEIYFCSYFIPSKWINTTMF